MCGKKGVILAVHDANIKTVAARRSAPERMSCDDGTEVLARVRLNEDAGSRRLPVRHQMSTRALPPSESPPPGPPVNSQKPARDALRYSNRSARPHCRRNSPGN